MEKVASSARRDFSFPSPVDVHRERCDEHNKKESDERPAAFQSTQSKRIPVMLSTHEAKNAEIVIRVVRFPRRRLGRRRVERLPAREWSRGDAGDIDGQTETSKPAGASESKLFGVSPANSGGGGPD